MSKTAILPEEMQTEADDEFIWRQKSNMFDGYIDDASGFTV